MSISDLASKIKEVFSDTPNLRPYDLCRIEIMLGLPPTPVRGLEYVLARHAAPQNKLFNCLTGKGAFVSNLNKSGIIEIGILDGSVSCAGIEVLELTGIPFPIAITDLDTGGTSTVIASACRKVGTPEWRRGRKPDVKVYQFAVNKLTISDGLRLLA